MTKCASARCFWAAFSMGNARQVTRSLTGELCGRWRPASRQPGASGDQVWDEYEAGCGPNAAAVIRTSVEQGCKKAGWRAAGGSQHRSVVPSFNQSRCKPRCAPGVAFC